MSDLDLDAIEERYQRALNARPSKGPITNTDALTDSVCDVPDLLAAVAAALVFHVPRRDGPLSLVDSVYCSCGTYEIRTMSDGYPSLVPAAYPCQTARALGVTADA